MINAHGQNVVLIFYHVYTHGQCLRRHCHDVNVRINIIKLFLANPNTEVVHVELHKVNDILSMHLVRVTFIESSTLPSLKVTKCSEQYDLVMNIGQIM